MRQLFLLVIVLTFHTASIGQISYKGFVDKFPIELVIETYSDGVAHGVYVYTNFDTPIPINGLRKENVLTLHELDASGKESATMTFSSFDPKSSKLEGVWKNLNTGKELKVTLKKDFEFDGQGDGILADHEMIQAESLKSLYFKVVVSQKIGYPRVIGIKLYEKRSDVLQMEFELECQLMGLSNVSVGDYNFDGLEDFSVFEHSFSGPNTSSIYFLFNPRANEFYRSEYSGVSLEFDAASKTIMETNSCCAGQIKTTSIYKVVDNKMVLIEEHCFTWDEDKGELVEQPLAKCK